MQQKACYVDDVMTPQTTVLFVKISNQKRIYVSIESNLGGISGSSPYSWLKLSSATFTPKIKLFFSFSVYR